MYRICYCYEAVQVLNNNVMFIHKMLRYKAVQVLNNNVMLLHKMLHNDMKPFKC